MHFGQKWPKIAGIGVLPQLDFPLIVTEAFDLAPTVFCWSAFCGNADIEKLRLAREAAHLKVQARNGRLKLVGQT